MFENQLHPITLANTGQDGEWLSTTVSKMVVCLRFSFCISWRIWFRCQQTMQILKWNCHISLRFLTMWLDKDLQSILLFCTLHRRLAFHKCKQSAIVEHMACSVAWPGLSAPAECTAAGAPLALHLGNIAYPTTCQGWSSPHCGDIWRRYCCLTSFSDCRFVP